MSKDNIENTSSDSEKLTSETTPEINTKDEKLRDLMKTVYSYPDPSDPDFQYEIYKKREFYYHKMKQRPDVKNYEQIKEYRDKICTRKGTLLEQQAFLGNFINPDTPFRGALVFMGTGTGKCQTPDSWVYGNGSLQRIGNLWDKYNSGIKFIDESGGQWSKPKEKLLVNSYDHITHKIIKQSVKLLYRQPVEEIIREIELENGLTIKVTKAHKLLKQDEWTNNLKVGDYVCVPKYIINCPEKNELDITDELVFFMSWQMAEGHERNDQFCLTITNDDIQILGQLKESIIKIGEKYSININKPDIKAPKNRSNYLQLDSKEYVEKLESFGYKWGNLSAHKVVPDFVMNLSKEKLKLFLRNYFDAEASINNQNCIIQIASASEILILQLIHLLRIFGIHSRIKKVLKMATNGRRIKGPQYVLHISSYSLQLFKQEIGFGFKYKQDILEKICIKKCNSTELIPVNHILYDLWKKTKLPYRQLAHHSYIHTDKLPSIDTIKNIINNLDRIIKNTSLQTKYQIIPSQLSMIIIARNELEKEINKEVYYIKIKNIKEKLYEGFVYDLEIDGQHNYVSNGILTHNTCAAITIAEKFKPMVQKYGTKIYVLVSGPLVKETWKRELLSCTGETYLKQQDINVYINEQEKQKIRKNAINIALQYYRFMSYRSFYKKVLGEKIVEKIKTKDNKIKTIYRKTEEGEFERDLAVDRIYNLNNSLIIVDEAHNLSDNMYGEALMKVIKASNNLKVVLLTATPMKNLADDIIELINFLRPVDDPIERDKIFTSHKNYLMEFKSGGIEYLKKMTRGYVSYLRGADPLTFAKRVDKGVIPQGLLFTKVTQCKMLPFQRKVYDGVVKSLLSTEERMPEDEKKDTLDRRSEAVANFAFPGLSQDKKELVGYFGREGINIVKNQLKTHLELINRKIALEILKNESLENDTDLLYISDNTRTVTGKILRMEYLKNFSVKFYKALKKINRLVWSKKGSKTAFVYSNLVKVGIEIFQEILLRNGYLEFDENPNNYKIKSDTRCYLCGLSFREHQQIKLEKKRQERVSSKTDKGTDNISESSSEYEKPNEGVSQVPEHVFHPAAFVSVTGKSSEEAADIIPEEKQHILDNIYSNVDNVEGKYIKLVLGSKVMNEGISLKNVGEVHILDVYFNLGKVDQCIGRAIRHCSHYQIMSEKNPYPNVNVYKYAVTIENGLSSEEELYKKAELKYILIKKVERALKENAIDCPLNRNGNIFPEELKQFKDCAEPSEPLKEGQLMCSALCDYMQCNFKCDSKKLNAAYFDETLNGYKSIPKDKLDSATFTQNLARNEIESAKIKIKELYRIKYIYTLKDIIKYVKDSYEGEKRDLFDEFFVFKALDELTPITENDFNNYRDTIYDKYNRQGYLIYIDRYYIFQPFDQNENVPMYYRSIFDKPLQSQLTLHNYLKNIARLPVPKIKEKKEEIPLDKPISVYDFESIMDYYENRDEFKYVGIVDKESSRRKTKSAEELLDVFKIREKRGKLLNKLRGTGISTLFGSVCSTSKSRFELEKIAKEVNIDVTNVDSRFDICERIKERLLFLEKYSTGKDKITYVMIPKNHPSYPFPYNLFDRKNYIINLIKEKIKFKLDIDTKDIKEKINNKNVTIYQIEIKKNDKLKEFNEFLISLGFKLEGNKWVMRIE
jgi:intein/homing endonuclease